MKKTLSFGMISILLFFPFVFGYGQPASFKVFQKVEVEQSEAYIEGNDYQKDFLLFISLLTETHPAFALRNPINIDSIQQAGYIRSGACNSDSELKYYLQSIASLLNDGHTKIAPNFDRTLIYPFALYMDDQNSYLLGVDTKFKASLGKEIVKINGIPTLELIASFKNQISADNEGHFRSQVKNYLQFYSIWQNNPHCSKDSTLTLTFNDLTTIKFKPMAQMAMNIAWQQSKTQSNILRQGTNMNFVYKLVPEKKICYLQFNKCKDQNTIREMLINQGQEINPELERKLASVPKFDLFLEDMFQSMKKNNIKTLVVDVSNNSGGNSRLCNLLLSYLKPLNKISWGTSSIRFSPLWEQTYYSSAEEFRNGFEKNNLTFPLGELYSSSDLSDIISRVDSKSTSNKEKAVYLQMNKKKRKIFKGDVVFIQSSTTYSSAGLLITMAKDNGIGKIIGSKSTYSPCHYGDLLAWELPNTNIQGYISHKSFFRPNLSTCGKPSLIPDVLIKTKWDDYLSGNDPCLEWVLENY